MKTYGKGPYTVTIADKDGLVINWWNIRVETSIPTSEEIAESIDEHEKEEA